MRRLLLAGALVLPACGADCGELTGLEARHLTAGLPPADTSAVPGGMWWRASASMMMTALVVSAFVTAPTLLLSGNARWWGVVGSLAVGVVLVVGLSRGAKRAVASGRGIRKSLLTSSEGRVEVQPVAFPAGFDPERWMKRAQRRVVVFKRVLPLLYLGGLGGGVGVGVALDSAAASILLGALGFLVAGALGMLLTIWPWRLMWRLRRLSSD